MAQPQVQYEALLQKCNDLFVVHDNRLDVQVSDENSRSVKELAKKLDINSLHHIIGISSENLTSNGTIKWKYITEEGEGYLQQTDTGWCTIADGYELMSISMTCVVHNGLTFELTCKQNNTEPPTVYKCETDVSEPERIHRFQFLFQKDGGKPEGIRTFQFSFQKDGNKELVAIFLFLILKTPPTQAVAETSVSRNKYEELLQKCNDLFVVHDNRLDVHVPDANSRSVKDLAKKLDTETESLHHIIGISFGNFTRSNGTIKWNYITEGRDTYFETTSSGKCTIVKGYELTSMSMTWVPSGTITFKLNESLTDYVNGSYVSQPEGIRTFEFSFQKDSKQQLVRIFLFLILEKSPTQEAVAETK